MGSIERFQQYADAFEVFFENDDVSVLEPYFTEDAAYERLGDPPLAGLDEGRDAVLAHLKASLDGLDRRFASRELEVLEGPEEREGAVWLRWRVTYRAGNAPPLVMEGEERAVFSGDRIQRLIDHFEPDAGKTALAWMTEHGAALGGS